MSMYGMAISDHSRATQFEACSSGVTDHPYYHKCYDCERGPEACHIGWELLRIAYMDNKLKDIDSTLNH